MVSSQEFLPICDVLFNIISLAAYFCNVVFDFVLVYTLYEGGLYVWFSVTLTCIITSLLLCQTCSLWWYLSRKDTRNRLDVGIVVVLHVLQLGVLWRYFKLFIPVDINLVKHDVSRHTHWVTSLRLRGIFD